MLSKAGMVLLTALLCGAGLLTARRAMVG
jgi:hypothetical protein